MFFTDNKDQAGTLLFYCPRALPALNEAAARVMYVICERDLEYVSEEDAVSEKRGGNMFFLIKKIKQEHC